MKEARHPIFRIDALRRYAQGRDQAVFPRFVSPRTFVYLWLLLGLLVGGAGVAWSTEAPVYASGLAVVVEARDLPPASDGELVAVAFLPPEHVARLRVGGTLLLHAGAEGSRVDSPIVAVEPDVRSPDAARARYAPDAGTPFPVTQPAAVAVTRFAPATATLPVSAYAGALYRVDLEIGSRRAISLLPVVGRLFPGRSG